MNKTTKLRTTKQNAALHKLFQELADELNDRGLYVGQVIRFDAPWDGPRVKELIWREVQKKVTGKQSTTKLTTREIDQVFEVIHRALSEKGVDIEFPSIETIMNKQRGWRV